ncbi:MAG: NCS2 family permease [Bacillota bacterium]
MVTLSDILAAVAVVLNGLPQGLLALTFGFAAFPTAIAFVIGIIGVIFFKLVTPISFQAETICLAGTLGRDRLERLNMVFWSGIIMAVIGILGLLEFTIDMIGPSILNGMMAGVGIMLAHVAINMIKSNKTIGAFSLAVALLTYFITDNLVYTIVASVFLSSFVWMYMKRTELSKKEVEASEDIEKISRIKVLVNPFIIRGALALATLQIGGNIAYGSITGNLAQSSVNIDHLTIYSGLASAGSALFGGGPVEAIISGTAIAPNPFITGILMMAIMAIILLSKLLPKLAKYVPSESIAGFLFVLGAIIVFPTNINLGLAGDPVVAGVTTVVTAATDPFLGMLAGLIVRAVIGL